MSIAIKKSLLINYESSPSNKETNLNWPNRSMLSQITDPIITTPECCNAAQIAK